MDIKQMHVWFRQYAQQMGMQNVRAILPEQIDLLINTSITDIVNEIIKTNIGITNDRVITDNSKIGQINALSTLYKVKEIYMCPTDNQVNTLNYKVPFYFNASDRKTGRMQGQEHPGGGTGGNSKNNNAIPEYLYLVDFSLNYKKAKEGSGIYSVYYDVYKGPEYDPKGIETNYFPVRIIDDAYLADTLNDFILKNRLRSPIIVNYNNSFDIYIDDFKLVQENVLPEGDKYDSPYDVYTLEYNLIPYKLRMSYIAKPAKVLYAEDLGGSKDDNVDCDLPEYMHVDVLKHAVDLWRIAVSGSLHSAQQQEQNAQQENMRNNYRNEGNQ